MKQKKKTDFAFIWKEERAKLAQAARKVPFGGTIVEIGTAEGGSAKIFSEATRRKKVQIYTIDTLKDPRAHKNLSSAGVNIIHRSSSQFAKEWAGKGRIIDLLFIDGSHTFQGVFKDFNSWACFVRPGGMIVFHDYDPAPRGGLAHFALRVCIDTVINKGLLDNVRHEYKLLSGRVKAGRVSLLRAEDCFKTLLGIAEGIVSFRKKVFSSSVNKGMEIIRGRKLKFDSVQACYCIAYALKNDFFYLDSRTGSFYGFRKLVELLSFFEHATGMPVFPDNLRRITASKDAAQLSRLIATEQVRINILSGILKTLVTWEP